MIPRLVRLIGILTLALVPLSLVIPYRLIERGVWISPVMLSDWSSFTGYVYYGLIVPIAAITLGIPTLLGKKWTWKGNVIFQAINIVAIGTIVLDRLTTVAFVYPNNPYYIFGQVQSPTSLILDFVILSLLFTSKTKAYYLKTPPSEET